MNSHRTTGKNLQTPSPSADDEGAYEIRAVSRSVPDGPSTHVFNSLAQRQRLSRPLPASQPEPRPTRNYGGRNLRYRWRDKLKPWQVHDWHSADAVAIQLGIPLNTFISICWEATFPGSAAMPSTFRRGMKRMAQWLRDNGLVFAFVYVHENPDDAKLNSHILVHVPKHLLRAFRAKAASWFEALDGGVRVDPRNDDKRRAKGLGTRLQYMAKGADYGTCRVYGGYRKKGGQGPVAIKRAGVAQCLRLKPVFSDAIKGGDEESRYAVRAREAGRYLTGNNGDQAT